jgi:glycosyltransferase involved in cell wall biosynthesis
MTANRSAGPIRVLALVSHYLPGERAGGPIRSISNLIEVLGDECSFTIVTDNYDLGSSAPYAGVPTEEWTTVGKARVLYLAKRGLRWYRMLSILRRSQYDVLYLSGVLCTRFSIAPMLFRRLGLIPHRPVVIAARGEFSRGALALKSRKKRAFFAAAEMIGLYRQPMITWHASTTDEEADIRRRFRDTASIPITHVAQNVVYAGRPPRVVTALDVTWCPVAPLAIERVGKTPGQLEAIFLSRVSPMKNLLGLLNALMRVSGSVRLDVYGPIGDAAYWASCLGVIDDLPAGIDVHYRGVVPNSQVQATFARYQLLVLPTLGENFGHVIAEALMAGCPVLTTDLTPWLEIQDQGAGSIVRGTGQAGIIDALQRHIDMGEVAQQRMIVAARQLGEKRATNPATIESSRALFANAASEAVAAAGQA